MCPLWCRNVSTMTPLTNMRKILAFQSALKVKKKDTFYVFNSHFLNLMVTLSNRVAVNACPRIDLDRSFKRMLFLRGEIFAGILFPVFSSLILPSSHKNRVMTSDLNKKLRNHWCPSPKRCHLLCTGVYSLHCPKPKQGSFRPKGPTLWLCPFSEFVIPTLLFFQLGSWHHLFAPGPFCFCLHIAHSHSIEFQGKVRCYPNTIGLLILHLRSHAIRGF